MSERRIDPMLSVVIPVYNEAGSIGPTMAAIRASTDLPLEIIVVDDGSIDQGCDALETDRWTRLLRQPHIGVAAARGRGARAARTDFLLFLDAHCRPEPGWLDVLLRALVPGDILTPAIGTSDGSAYGYGLTLTSPKFDYKWLPLQSEERGSPIYPVPISGGGCMFMRKDWYDYLGGFDTMQGWGIEDTELCLRSWAAGGRVQVASQARIRHHFKTNETAGRATEWAAFLYNIMRAAILHHPQDERFAVFQSLRQWPDQYHEATIRLRQSDIWKRYDRFRQIKRRDLGWLCRSFGIDLHVPPAPDPSSTPLNPGVIQNGREMDPEGNQATRCPHPESGSAGQDRFGDDQVARQASLDSNEKTNCLGQDLAQDAQVRAPKIGGVHVRSPHGA